MIRKYREEDSEQVIGIWLRGSFIAHNFIPKEYWESKADNMKNIYLPSSNTYVYIDEEEKVLGFISMVDNYIAAIFVDPKHQGKGIGCELMAYASTMHQTLTLRVYKDNHRSVEFYKKQGFAVVEEMTEEGTGHREYVMSKEV